jgi:two-component system cell cycle sensor histidine kinase/response regulator CckA
MKSAAPPSSYSRPWPFLLTLLLGLSGAVAAGYLGYRAEESRRNQRLEGETALRIQQVKGELEKHAFVLAAIAAHFELHPPKTDAEYETYLQRIDPVGNFQGLRGVNLGLLVRPEELRAFAESARNDRSLRPEGHPDFLIHPALSPDEPGPHPLIRFIHPFEGNRLALGYHSGSLPQQRSSLLLTLRTGEITSTGPVPIAQDPSGPPGLILRKALGGGRDRAPWGYLNTIWQPQRSLQVPQNGNRARVLAQLVDLGPNDSPQAPVSFYGPNIDPHQAHVRTSRLEFAGRTLELRIQPIPGAPGFGPIWWPWALSGSLVAITVLAALRHLAIRSMAARIQKELQQTEHQLQTVLSNYPDLLIILNEDLTYRDVYTGREDLLIYPKQELLGRFMPETLPPELGTRVAEASRTVLKQGGQVSLEYDLELPDGVHRFEARGARLEALEKQPLAMVWSIRDITARTETEALLRQREEEFRGFFESAPSPLLISRMEDGTVLFANAALRRLMEYPADAELRGQTPDYYAEPEQRQGLVQKLMKFGKFRGEELSLLTATRHRRQVLVSCDVIHLGGEKVLLSSFHDLTEQRESEEALRQTQKLESLGLMASGIAHDFNNLLTAVQGNLELARVGASAQDRQSAIDAAEQAVMRAADLTRQLLAYSGKTPLSRTRIDLGALVKEMGGLLRVSIPKATALDIQIPANLPSIEGDRAQLQQVMLNLISNASDAVGPHGGRVEIRAGQVELENLEPFPGQELSPGAHAWISVRDTGHGMSDEVKARIFDPFFTTKTTGRGLGLSAMQGILRAHHAGLQIESTLGEGSTFTLYFPALPQANLPAKVDRPAEHRPFQGRLLLVDDEEHVRTATAEVLGILGFQVTAVSGGALALEELQKPEPWALVLLDLTMPPPDGMAVLRQLRAMHPALPVILCSGYSDAAPEELGQDPHLGFLPKPFTLSELKRALTARLQA